MGVYPMDVSRSSMLSNFLPGFYTTAKLGFPIHKTGKSVTFKPIKIAGKVYGFDHLKPVTLAVQPDAKLETKALRILVNFSCHCFTGKFDGNPAFEYRHGNEVRCFDEERFSLSFNLSAMVQAIADKKVYFTRETNYLTVEVVDHDGKRLRYTMFFDLKRARDAGHDLVMTVESAYIKDAFPKHLDKIRFRILAGKIARGQRVRSPYHFQKGK